MSVRATFRRSAREWLIALASFALLVAPFGCEFQSQLLEDLLAGAGGSNLTTESAGLFINPDTTDPLMIAGRNAGGDAFFVYGSRKASGEVEEIESILVVTADGQQSFITFELGRPVYLEGPDGSNIRIRYDEVSSTRLAATIEVTDPAGTSDTVTAEIDLQKTAAQVAETVQQLTGRTLEVTAVPDVGTTKWQQRAVSTWLIVAAVVPLVLLNHLMIVILGQITRPIIEAINASLQAAAFVALLPLFAFTGLLGDVIVRIQSVPLLRIFVHLPNPPGGGR